MNYGSHMKLKIKEGDVNVAVLKKNCTARCLWKLARIIVELLTGRVAQ